MPTITKHVQGDGQYAAVQYDELGSWNPTLNDANEETNEFYVVKNLRMETPGQYTKRSGYRSFTSTDLASVPATSTVYFKGEYDIVDNTGLENSFDVTLYYDPTGQTVSLIFFNKTTQTVQLKIDVETSILTAPKNVEGCQWESYFLVTIFGKGLYAVYPKTEADVGSTNPADWNVIHAGKELANPPTLSTARIAATTTGDLIIRQNHNDNENMVLDYQAGQQEPPWQRLPINAKYWLANDPTKFFTAAYKAWDWDVNDPNDYLAYTPLVSSTDHVQTRAWGYRAVFVQEVINTKGEKITYRSHPSVDWWVPNRLYSSAYLGYDGTHGSTKGAYAQWINRLPGSSLWRFGLYFPANGKWNDGPNEYFLNGIPSLQDLMDLQLVYRQYFHSDGDPFQAGGTDDPYYFPAGFLGWITADQDIHYKGNAPYVIPVSAYDLKQAPLADFHWDDFALDPDFPANTTKIEIYRTAFNGKNAQGQQQTDTAGASLFQPHLYGYVGSLQVDGTFVDDVKDTAIDFGKTPESNDGYLFGQFSGCVIREYMNKVALGAIESHYKVFAPARTQHSIGVNLVSGSGAVSPATINSTYVFYYQYQDIDGRLSDLQEVVVDVTDVSVAINTLVFRVPYGYDPNIVKVNIVYQNVITSKYYLISTVDVLTGYYKAACDILLTPPAEYTTITADDKVTTEPGGILYSEPNLFFHFPFTNVEIVHKFAPITFMETITGPLWVWTDRSVTLTTLDNFNPRTEEETKAVGNIGFNSAVKANKIVFFLSAHGMYYAEASGAVPFPSRLQTIVLPYLNEEIADQPQLLNARRAAISYLGQRDELWVHFPSSVDLGGTLPERTFIYKCWNGNPNNVTNYEFELINPLDSEQSPITKPVVFRNHTDGTLYSSYLDPDEEAIVIVNNDVIDSTNRWLGPTYLEKRLVLSNPGKKKKLRAVSWRAGGLSKMWVITGRPYFTNQPIPPNTPDYLGELYNDGTLAVNKYEVAKNSDTTNPQLLKHRANGKSIETTAYILGIRIVTEPDDEDNNEITYYALNAFLSMFDHP